VELQDMRLRLQPFTNVLDKEGTLGQSAKLLLARQCYQRTGQRFSEWLDSAPDPLQAHVQTIRKSSQFSMDLAEEIHGMGDKIPLEVRVFESLYCTQLLCLPRSVSHWWVGYPGYAWLSLSSL
jgi:hypothetical protein